MSGKIESIRKELQEHTSNGELHAARNKCLVFDIGDDMFGIPLSMVKEVIGLTGITSVPSAPIFFKGIINLRGQIISVIDFRIKVGMPEVQYCEKKTTIIIAEIEDITIGTIVDDVREVANFEASQIEKGLEIQGQLGKEFITGVAKDEKNRLILLLDIGKVLSVDELKLIKKANK